MMSIFDSERCYAVCTHGGSYLLSALRFAEITYDPAKLKYYKTKQQLLKPYRDTSVKMRFGIARLIATKFAPIKFALTRITAKIYCRAKRHIPSCFPLSHPSDRAILLIIIMMYLYY